ncbi:MAG: Lrp/AsnC family transcriptional regulator [Candidatus Thorarchaeota archaeon]|nr:Lrp/AsnC family transcriptional regulator [Candidatus Thorarchaeota archaeon]
MEEEREDEEKQEEGLTASRDALVGLWRDSVLRCANRFGLSPSLVDSPTTVSSSASVGWPESFDQMVSLDGGTVEIPNITGTTAALLRALIARESLRLLLPNDVLHERAIADLASEYGRQQLEERGLALWSEEWQRRSPRTAIRAGGVYDPVLFFTTLANLTDKKGLNLLVSRVLAMERTSIRAGIDEWGWYLHRFLREYNHPLSEIEVRVLEELLNEPDLTREALSDRLCVSADWIGKTIQGLRARGQLKEFVHLSLPALAIRTVQMLLLPGENSPIDCERLIEHCPFVYSSHQVVTGRGGLYITFCVPDNNRNMSYLHRMTQAAQRTGHEVIEFERCRSARYHNLDCYSCRTGNWEIDWPTVQMDLEYLLSSTGGHDALPPEPPARVAQYDGLDVQILVQIQKGVHKVNDLQRIVKRRTALVSERVNHLRSLGVVKHFWELHYVGLINDVLLIARDAEPSRALRAAAPRLPKCVLDTDTKNGTLVRAQLPVGGTLQFVRAFEHLDRRPYVYVIGPRLYGQWLLSDFIADWNSYAGTWSPHEQGIDNWLEILEQY